MCKTRLNQTQEKDAIRRKQDLTWHTVYNKLL